MFVFLVCFTILNNCNPLPSVFQYYIPNVIYRFSPYMKLGIEYTFNISLHFPFFIVPHLVILFITELYISDKIFVKFFQNNL